VTAVVGRSFSEYLPGMRAAVFLLAGCSLPKSDPGPVEQSRPVEDSESPPVGDSSPPVEDTSPPAPAPQIHVDPTSVDLGDVPIGTSIEEMIEIASVGSADLHVEALDYVSVGPNDWALELEDGLIPALVPPG
jgi:hypothetical protein